jgi:hypothetical protein
LIRQVCYYQKLLGGSRLRNQNEIATTIAELLSPADLVDLAEAGDAEKLASVLDRDLIQITRLMSYLIDSNELYELEAHIFEDKLSISMFDEGQSKSVRDLSNGQKATALLPLILRNAEYPLIFDQPEDDLDNRFIFTSLSEVETLALIASATAFCQEESANPTRVLNSLQIKLLPGGRSCEKVISIIFDGTGLPSVVKIGKRSSIMNELTRFKTFVNNNDNNLKPYSHFHCDIGVIIWSSIGNPSAPSKLAPTLEAQRDYCGSPLNCRRVIG